jgi:inner membrane protein
LDFITQNLIGAVAGHAALGRPRLKGGLGRLALLAGAAGGAVPDFDFLLQPFADAALPYELHRHFTHALVFIPVGGLLAALPFLVLPTGRRKFGIVYGATTIGCATHGLLDNLTSYGTHLLWPFVDHRTAWDAMSIVDPIFTLVLLLGVVGAAIRGGVRATRLSAVAALAYVSFGFVQHDRALDAQRELARERGHEIARGRVLPTLGNVVVFRSVYESKGRIWADAVRVAPLGRVTVREGAARPRFIEDDLPGGSSLRARSVFGRMSSFAGGFVGEVEPPHGAGDAIVLGDMRFSMETTGFRPLWGIAIDPGGEPRAWDAFHAPTGRAAGALRQLWYDVVSPEDRFRPLGGEASGGEGDGYR